MDGWLRALWTVGTVALVMGVARHAGQRVAGLVAALPTVTALMLVWLVHERGLAFAVNTAIGSVSACAMLAAFALVYAWMAPRGGVGAALVGGLVGGVAMAGPALQMSDHLAAAALFALAVCTAAVALMPSLRASVARGRCTGAETAFTALAAGGLSVLAATLGPALGTFATGLLSSLPVVSAVVAATEHRAGGGRAVVQFLRGYLAGLFGKIAFGVVFVLLAKTLGATWALAMACACACIATALAGRVLQLASLRTTGGIRARAATST